MKYTLETKQDGTTDIVSRSHIYVYYLVNYSERKLFFELENKLLEPDTRFNISFEYQIIEINDIQFFINNDLTSIVVPTNNLTYTDIISLFSKYYSNLFLQQSQGSYQEYYIEDIVRIFTFKNQIHFTDTEWYILSQYVNSGKCSIKLRNKIYSITEFMLQNKRIPDETIIKNSNIVFLDLYRKYDIFIDNKYFKQQISKLHGLSSSDEIILGFKYCCSDLLSHMFRIKSITLTNEIFENLLQNETIIDIPKQYYGLFKIVDIENISKYYDKKPWLDNLVKSINN